MTTPTVNIPPVPETTSLYQVPQNTPMEPRVTPPQNTSTERRPRVSRVHYELTFTRDLFLTRIIDSYGMNSPMTPPLTHTRVILLNVETCYNAASITCFAVSGFLVIRKFIL